MRRGEDVNAERWRRSGRDAQARRERYIRGLQRHIAARGIDGLCFGGVPLSCLKYGGLSSLERGITEGLQFWKQPRWRRVQSELQTRQRCRERPRDDQFLQRRQTIHVLEFTQVQSSVAAILNGQGKQLLRDRTVPQTDQRFQLGHAVEAQFGQQGKTREQRTEMCAIERRSDFQAGELRAARQTVDDCIRGDRLGPRIFDVQIH